MQIQIKYNVKFNQRSFFPVVLKLKHVDRWTDRVHICKQFMHIVQNVHSKANGVKISALNAKLNWNKSTHY